MSVTQYIGARYVPLFATPEQWSSERAYEPLTIVLHEGNSYTSKQAVPIGIDIQNNEFWALTGNYNAQVEAYRREVAQLADDIEAAQQAADEAKEAVTAEATAREEADSGLQADIQAEATARENEIDAINSDNWVTPNRLSAEVNSKIEFNSNNFYTEDKEGIFYIATSGNDDNDGLSEETPFKTISRCLEEINKGYSNFSVVFSESGTYTCDIPKVILTNLDLHIGTKENISGVTVVLNGNIRTYNCYIDVYSSDNNPISITFNGGLHADYCGIYTINTKATFNLNTNFNFCKIGIDTGTIINTAVRLVHYNSDISIAVNANVAINSTALVQTSPLFFQACKIVYYGAISFSSLPADTQPLFRVEASTIAFANNAITITNNAENIMLLRYSSAFIHSSLWQLFNEKVSGNYSYINKTGTIQIF